MVLHIVDSSFSFILWKWISQLWLFNFHNFVRESRWLYKNRSSFLDSLDLRFLARLKIVLQKLVHNFLVFRDRREESVTLDSYRYIIYSVSKFSMICFIFCNSTRQQYIQTVFFPLHGNFWVVTLTIYRWDECVWKECKWMLIDNCCYVLFCHFPKCYTYHLYT